MDPNLKASVGYKELLLRKLSYAVVSSLLSQIVMLVIFLFTVNFNVLNPQQWLSQSTATLMSLNTWLFLILFSCIVFAQSIICAKDYVLQASFSSTRFQKIFNIFSVRNFILLILHVSVGGLSVWLHLSIADLHIYDEERDCKNGYYCLHEGKFFLICSGLWVGLYFFIRVYMTDKKLEFPVIQQRKLLQFKARLVPLIKESRNASFWPVLYFCVMYTLFHSHIKSFIASSYGVLISEESVGVLFYFYAWIFGGIFFFSMNLKRFFFTLYLTEPIQFSLVHSEELLNLQQAINVSSLPIVQNLAALDFYILSYWSSSRRQTLFSLSQPGGHPYNWNALIQNVLKLLNDYKSLINKSVDSMISSEKVSKQSAPVQEKIPAIKSPLNKSGNLRNMSLHFTEPLDVISVEQTRTNAIPLVSKETSKQAIEKVQSFMQVIKRKVGYNYLFDDLPESTIQKCLSNGQVVIWTSQGIANLTSASLHEDSYGVLQKDLPIIITTLVELKQSLDRLNKVSFGRKYESFDANMKLALNSAVKRSLVNLSKNFGVYLSDLSLKKEVVQQLQNYVQYIDC